MRAFLIIILLSVFFITNIRSVSAETHEAHYGRWEKYSLRDQLTFPDFTLRFVGSEPGAFYPGSTGQRMGRYLNSSPLRAASNVK